MRKKPITMKKRNPFKAGSLNAVIWNGLYYYPSLYNSGSQVLEHLYCTIGNGFEWENGVLKDIYPEKTAKKIDTKIKIKTECSELEAQFRVQEKREENRQHFVRDNARLLTLYQDEEWKSVYPVCQYSAIYTIPKNAKEDFVAGARQSIHLAYQVLAKKGCTQQTRGLTPNLPRHKKTKR